LSFGERGIADMILLAGTYHHAQLSEARPVTR